jgi:superfamily II DNA or RNA helicase
LVIVDEAHHSTAKTYRRILEAFPESLILGVTATPCRLDGGGFRGLFDELICGVTVKQLIGMGSLSPYKYFVPDRVMSIEGVRKKAGDYRTSDLAAANDADSVAADCVKSYRDYLEGKQAVIFAINIEQSHAIACSFQTNGISSAHLDGASDHHTRSLTMEAFREGKIQVLTNCALFDEGLDIPALDGVILARPTASLGRYLQMVGRALRPAPNKEHARIIDLAGNWSRHGLPCDEREWSLDGVKTKPRGKARQLQRKEDGQIEEITIDLTPSNIQLTEITQSLDLDRIWQKVLNLLTLDTRLLFEKFGLLQSLTATEAAIAMKSPTMRQIAMGKIPTLAKVFSEVLGFPVAVRLEVMTAQEWELVQWFDRLEQLCQEQQQRGYKAGWLGFKLAELQPPIEVWLRAENYLGYKRGWAYHKFRESQGVGV